MGALIATAVQMIPGLYWWLVGAFIVMTALVLVVGQLYARRLARSRSSG